MAGIYIHIPFCKTRCYYCDFFKSTKLNLREQFIEKLFEEIVERRSFFENTEKSISTIYFGGGTPSLFSEKYFNDVLNRISTHYSLENNVEITIEVNPDDLNLEYLKSLYSIGINRLSIGVQSFYDVDLKKMGRRHDAAQSRQVLEWAFQSGFQNVGADLIYGLPWSNAATFLSNLDILKEYPVKHLSAYHLTIEQGTYFGRLKRNNKLVEIDDSESEALFWKLHDKTIHMGFEHYEISNFCKDGLYSKHNTAYWNDEPYLGLGPGAHSFDGKKRYWNKSDLQQYIKNGFSDGLASETLDGYDRFNEFLMLRLRTARGICIKQVENCFENGWKKIETKIRKWVNDGFLEVNDGFIYGSRKGWFVIDGIIKDLFIVE
ncbi:radical SAM family heme chaperone HemW [Thermophagus sp. OGC60D27]|uniref:radical SAM family heme chaperone HemW n=1 Tax=Thermophagus sp. OGC60D27 TaxID=3458415 RepID=UPI00403788DB